MSSDFLNQISVDFGEPVAAIRSTTTSIPASLKPSLAPSAHLSLTVTCIVLFSLLFIFVYVQLWMILYYKHRKRSYQTVFLFLCLIWAALRVTLFSFYFTDKDTIIANNLQPFPNWLLYSLPVVLQFTTLVILVAFFSQVVIKARHAESARIYKIRVRIVCGLSVFIFTTVNVVCGIIAQIHRSDACTTSFDAVVVRVAINGFFFAAHGIALSYCIFTLNKIANARTLLESRGTSLCQSWTTCIFIVFIFVSRAVYNVLALCLRTYMPNLGYSWINVTDQADLVDLGESYYYPVYLSVLFLWEILPTVIVTVFFRVQKPSSIPETSMDDVSYRQQYFFDNPRRYDSDEDLSVRYASQSFNGSNRYNYGSINPNTGAPGESPIGRVPKYDPRLTKSASQSYQDPEYNGT